MSSPRQISPQFTSVNLIDGSSSLIDGPHGLIVEAPKLIDEASRLPAQAVRRYPSLVDNMWEARNVARGESSVTLDEDE